MWTFTKTLIAGAISLCWVQGLTPGAGGTSNVAPATPLTQTAAAAPLASQPVITVRGVCDEDTQRRASDANACTTVVTREQFEHLEQALHPGQELPAPARNNLARIYAEYITIEAATRKAGMEDTAEFHEFMNWMRVLAASEYYRRKLQQKYSNPPQEEIDAYYKAHLADYEAVKLVRILIPRENAVVANKDELDKKAHDVADTAHTNLAKGMDPTEVQKSVYATLGLQEPPPAVDVGKRRRKDLAAEQAAEVFSLKSDEVTKVQTEPKSYVIYKVMSRETATEESLKNLISGQIAQGKFAETMKSLVDSAQVDLNEQYFGPPTAADTEPVRNPHTIVTH